MRRLDRKKCVALGFLSLLGATPARALTTNLEADSYTASNATASNHGTKNKLDISGPSGTVRTIYVRFDLSELPAGVTGADVSKATITVFVSKVSTAGSLDVVRVTGAWSESAITAGTSPTLGAVEQSAVPITGSDKSQFKSVDVTAVVKDWLDGVLTNNGLAFVANPVDGLNARFDSKENKANSQVPRLEIALEISEGTVTSVTAASPLSVTDPTTTPNLTLGTVPLSLGGTGATTAAAARGNLAAAMSGANADISAIDGLGVGSASTPSMRFASDPDTGIFSPGADTVTIATGGTSRLSVGNSAVSVAGNLELPSSSATAGNVLKGGSLFLHDFGTDNVFLGADAGNLSLTGVLNVGVGDGSLQNSTDAVGNTALGAATLGNTTTGSLNTAAGAGALSDNVSGNSNVAVGVNGLRLNTTGDDNTAVGNDALINNTAGSGNTAIGQQALYWNTGDANVALGKSALHANTTGTRNTGLGYAALQDNTTGLDNIGVGFTALASNVGGGGNTALGNSALRENVSGSRNVAVGTDALRLNTANDNTAVGHQALTSNVTGGFNSAVGRESLQSLNGGSENTAVGFRALKQNVTGSRNTSVGNGSLENNLAADNTAVGYLALLNNTTGDRNAALGGGALFANTTGTQNTAVGVDALGANTTQPTNTAVGYQAMMSNTSGRGTAVGWWALRSNTTGTNTALGIGAGFGITTGTRNLSIGDSSQQSNVTGSFNVAVGDFALFNNTASGNIGLGNSAGASLTSGSDNIDIGNSGVAGDSGTIRLGTVGTHTSTFVAGIHGQTSASGINVLVNGSGRLGTTTSSARFKQDIESMSAASSGLMKLRPVTFHYKPEVDDSGLLQYGLIAEEVAAIYPDMVVWEDGRPQTVRYHFLVPMLLNELQKQHREQGAQAAQLHAVRAGESRMAELERENRDLRDRLAAVEHVVRDLARDPAPAQLACGR